MKVLIVSPDIEYPNHSGIQVILKSLIRGLQDNGHETILLSGNLSVASGSSLNEAINSKLQTLYLRHYVIDGLGPFYRKLKEKKILKGNRFYYGLKTILGILFQRPTAFKLDHDLDLNTPLLKCVDRAVNVPLVYELIRKRNSWIRELLLKTLLRKIKKSYHIDTVLCASPIVIPKVSGIKNVQFVHDIIPLQLTEDSLDANNPYLFAKTIHHVLENSDLILTNSENTKHKILNLLEKTNVEVVYGSVQFSSQIENSKVVLEKYGLESNSYLYQITSIEKRKNIIKLIEAYLLTYDELGLKLVLSGNLVDDIDQIVDEVLLNFKLSLHPVVRSIVKRNIIFTGYISDVEKQALMKDSKGTVMPTIFEGLGLQILEAFKLKCPVIVTRVGGIPEIAQDAVFYIENPYDEVEISNAMMEVSANQELRSSMVKKGYEIQKKFDQKAFTVRLHDALNKLANHA